VSSMKCLSTFHPLEDDDTAIPEVDKGF